MLFHYFSLLGILTLLGGGFAQIGLHHATNLLRGNLRHAPAMRDVILSGITTPWEENAYKLQVIRVRLGTAWELASRDYGFNEGLAPYRIDLIHPQRKLAIELKNNDKIGSREKRIIHDQLMAFKQQHPDYTVVFGFINSKRDRDTVKDGIRYIHGNPLLRLVFGVHQRAVIRQLRLAVQSHF